MYFYKMIYNSDNLRQVLRNPLPGRVSHLKMLPPERHLNFSFEEIDELKRSSVLLLLFEDNGELYTCMIKRPFHMKNHAGQIAFPGGRIEKTETAIETAFRETNEEIGISPESVSFLGQLSEVFISVSGFHIQPFVGWLEKKPECFINYNEVEKILYFPLSKFNKSIELIETETKSGSMKVPCVQFEGEIIWGASAMILAELCDVIY